jgi:hypothetical protein
MTLTPGRFGHVGLARRQRQRRQRRRRCRRERQQQSQEVPAKGLVENVAAANVHLGIHAIEPFSSSLTKRPKIQRRVRFDPIFEFVKLK